MADIPKEKIIHMRDEVEAASHMNTEGIDTVYVLYDVYTIHLRDAVKAAVKELINKEKTE